MAYTTSTKVGEYLGRTLTAPQTSQAAYLIAAAKAWIDRYTGDAWDTTSPVSAELHTIEGPYLFLKNAPITAITSMTMRSTYPGATTGTLPVSSYELLDATNGIVRVSGHVGSLASVTYTIPTDTVPADVELAATMLVAHWLTTTLQPETHGLESLNLAQGEINMRFSRTTESSPAPLGVEALLAPRRRVVFA